MLEEFERLKFSIKSIREQLNYLPKGNLICAKNGRYMKWYCYDGKNTSYIPKSDRTLAEQLAARKYLELLQKEYMAESQAVQAFLKKYPKEKNSQLLFEHAEYSQLLRPYFQPVDQELAEWQSASYQKSLKYPEQLIHKCGTGDMVRSKSEAMIVTFLQLHKIPFRYECALELDHVVFYPDFTIRHPVTGELYFWEHFGMMDDPEYARKCCSKMQIYVSHGMIPTIQLITTYETKEHPLTIERIENTIQTYFGQ